MSSLKHEQRALVAGIYFNIVMAILGLLFAYLTSSSAVLLDGLFSCVMVFASVAALKVSKDVQKGESKEYPMGRYTKETLFVLVRSILVLLLLTVTTTLNILNLIALAKGSLQNNLASTPLFLYGTLMVLLCSALVVIYRVANKKMRNSSSILKAESMSSTLDGLISLSVVITLLLSGLSPFLRNNISYVDNGLAIALSVLYAKAPLKLIVKQLRILSYKRTNPIAEKSMVATIAKEHKDVDVVDLFVSELGNFKEVYMTVDFDGTHTVDELDAKRKKIETTVKKNNKNYNCYINFSKRNISAREYL